MRSSKIVRTFWLVCGLLMLSMGAMACNGGDGEGGAEGDTDDVVAEAGPLCDEEGPEMPDVTAEGYTELDNGLRYRDLTVGAGQEVVEGTSVQVNYAGYLEDGTQFDTSCGRGPLPVTVGTGQVIRGWDLGLQGMSAGGRRILVIPSELGYGPAGSPPVIPPDATLIFDVEILSAQ